MWKFWESLFSLCLHVVPFVWKIWRPGIVREFKICPGNIGEIWCLETWTSWTSVLRQNSCLGEPVKNIERLVKYDVIHNVVFSDCKEWILSSKQCHSCLKTHYVTSAATFIASTNIWKNHGNVRECCAGENWPWMICGVFRKQWSDSVLAFGGVKYARKLSRAGLTSTGD